MLANTPGDSPDQVLAATLPRAEGAYCLLLLTRDSAIAARDPLGIRPVAPGLFGNLTGPLGPLASAAVGTAAGGMLDYRTVRRKRRTNGWVAIDTEIRSATQRGAR